MSLLYHFVNLIPSSALDSLYFDEVFSNLHATVEYCSWAYLGQGMTRQRSYKNRQSMEGKLKQDVWHFWIYDVVIITPRSSYVPSSLQFLCVQVSLRSRVMPSGSMSQQHVSLGRYLRRQREVGQASNIKYIHNTHYFPS